MTFLTFYVRQIYNATRVLGQKTGRTQLSICLDSSLIASPFADLSSKFIHTSRMASGKLDNVSDVVIDSGRFKYVLIKVTDKESKQSKNIVRGHASAPFHADIFEDVESDLKEQGFAVKCLGGGRIIHDNAAKKLEVFGYSQGYGKADHSITTEILKAHYPEYKSITWSDEGY